MPYYRIRRIGCGGLIGRIVLLLILGVVALICLANRSWFENRALDMLYGTTPKIHAGKAFHPGASAVEDGMRQTAVLVHGLPHVQVAAPPSQAWMSHHKDAVCKHDVCVAVATSKNFAGGQLGIGSVLAALLGGYIMWILVVGDDESPEERVYARMADRYR